MFAEDRQAAGSRRSRVLDESGVALITALLVVMLISGLMAGMFAAVIADQRSGSLDRDQTQVYAAAHAGLEKLTADLASLFVTDFNPVADDLDALTTLARVPDVDGFEYTEPGGAEGSGYEVLWTGKPADPVPIANTTITAGPYAGFQGLLTRYDVVVTARSASGSEVRLRRGLQTVAVPVFQFGVFSEDDLTFYGGDAFDFGGRVHTNGNLWLSESAAAGATLTFSDRITAYGDVNRRYLSNGLEASLYGMSGPVRILTQIGNAASAVTLQYSPNWSSVTNAAGGFWNTANPPVWQANGALQNSLGNPSWTTVSQSYNSNISNRLTGATVLRLPLTTQGATPVDLIKRPVVNSDEDTVNAPVYGQRYFAQASLRILLSDRLSDIEDLPTVTDGAVLLDATWVPGNAAHPPIARSIGPLAGTSINAAPAGASGVMTINVTSVPLQFRVTPDPLIANINVGGQLVACTGKTQNTFTGCTALTAIKAAGTVVQSAQPSGALASTTTAGALNVIGATTITVATNGTAGFAPIHFWANGTTSVSCQGFQETAAPAPVVHRYTNCAFVGAAPVNGNLITSQATAALNEELIGGFIKIERSNGASPAVWTDVTTEILNLGTAAPNQEGVICQDPTPDAVLRIQRLRDNGGTPNTGVPATPCPTGYANSTNAYDYWPNALYDAREGNYRPAIAIASPMYVGGVMNYIALDVNNLRRWLAGTIPAAGSTGPQAVDNNGYIVYFSDRRGDHTDAGTFPETGEYGSEDFVNTGLTGLPVNGTLQAGENVNGVNGLDVYGQSPHRLGVQEATDATFDANYTAPFNRAARPSNVIPLIQGQSPRMNRQVLFRKALKLVNAGVVAGASRLPANGLTVVAENPVYVQGNYNAGTDPVANPNEAHAPAAIIADAVSILSNNWTDARSFRFPNDAASRPATTTGYRFAVVTGKSLSFSNATLALAPAAAFLFGTDGGAGNFLRMMEDWRNGAPDLNYRGSMVSLFISRQATGTFKYGAPHNVYDYADRNFRFDSEFLQPALLPPGTPMFRDVNMLTFRQILRPNQ